MYCVYMYVQEYVSAYIKTRYEEDKYYLRNFIFTVEVLKNFIFSVEVFKNFIFTVEVLKNFTQNKWIKMTKIFF
jgi:hypothetical protein